MADNVRGYPQLLVKRVVCMAKHRYTDEEIAEWRKTHGNFIYYNKDDSNFLVPKPFGIGRTYNWAHPISWVLGAALVALLLYGIIFR
jgi:uncharacterized membrane protein